MFGSSVAQAVRRSSPTAAGVPISRLGHSMWVSWWMKWSVGRGFLGISLVFPDHKFRSTIFSLVSAFSQKNKT